MSDPSSELLFLPPVDEFIRMKCFDGGIGGFPRPDTNGGERWCVWIPETD